VRTCEHHLPVVTIHVWRRVLHLRKPYFLRCWQCQAKWGPFTHDRAFTMYRMVDQVAWRAGHAHQH
jgi:hypothetical protein